ncbi:MAG: two-component regulator propeller domain-containing protein, partial [Saprospiraceae bacterium]|nr:two-component regulator propeller domain-containing protein [Saprospiraceae bacterium]
HGNIWVGTEHGGLNQMTAEGVFKRWNLDSTSSTIIPSDVILCLYEDSQGRIWVGTEGGGLHMIHGDRSGSRQFTVQDGLPSNVINAIEEDGAGLLWLSTTLGLCSFDPERVVAIRYGKNDGLSSNQFNPNASIALRSREILFGNIKGLDGFYPDGVKPISVPASIVYTDFKVFDESVGVGDFHGRRLLSASINNRPEIRLGRFENAFSIGFAALDYAHPHRIKYAYRLKGLQDEWVSVGADQRMTTFTNLDPGTYFFQVRASGPSADWEVFSEPLRIERLPSFWETDLFKAAVVLCLLAPFLIYLRYVNWKRQEEHKREVALAHQEILRLKNEQLESEVNRKNAELSAALLQSAHKNKTLEGLRKQLYELSKQIQQDAGERRQLRKLVRKIDGEVESKDYWEQFQLNFDQVHQNFAHRLQDRHPELTPNDVRLCCLVRINLTNREVAAIQNISLAGVEKAKYRLKRKLDLPADQDLNRYILHLS